MFKPSIVSTGAAAAIALSCVMLLGCPKAKTDEDKPVVIATAKPAPPPPPAAPAAPPQGDVPFKGTYTKYAETTYKNGRRVSVSNAQGVATLQIEPGKVTYAQTYTARGKSQSVTQIYTFGSADVKTAASSAYDVPMVFQSMTGDTKNYSPDKNRPKIEARKQAAGWEIGLLTTDTNGVMGGVEFR